MTPDKAGELVMAQLQLPGLVVRHVHQNDTEYAVSYGRADRRPLVSIPIALVDKQSGAIRYLPYLGNEEFINSMTEA